jgi:hypothetical protein
MMMLVFELYSMRVVAGVAIAILREKLNRIVRPRD